MGGDAFFVMFDIETREPGTYANKSTEHQAKRRARIGIRRCVLHSIGGLLIRDLASNRD